MWWTIFQPILVQMVLKLIAKPLKNFGCKLEFLLNFNIQKDSKDYYSIVGHTDTRLDLDQKIKHGDGRYYPTLSMMASKLAYENKAVIQSTVSQLWKMEFVDYYQFYNEFQCKLTTRAFIFREENIDGDMIVVAFKGSSPFSADELINDIDIALVKIEDMRKAHMGYMSALGLNKYSHEDYMYPGEFVGYWPKQIEQNPQKPLAYYTIREKLKEMLETNENARIIVTGFGTGGALALLFPAVLCLHGEVEVLDKMEGIYTYGQPRVGNQEFGEFMKRNLREHNIKYYRIFYGYDIVPHQIPPRDDASMPFKHFGIALHFNSLYHGKIVEKEEDRNGVIMRLVHYVILARLIAVWQLIRGFINGYIEGPEFKEGWFLLGLRFIGILLPCIIDHFPQNYVNSTRLASDHIFKAYAARLSSKDSA